MPRIEISAPRTGLARSQFVGVGAMQNLDIDSVQGLARLNNILVKKSSTTVTATINWIVRDPVTIANIYAIDSAGDVYVSTNSGATWAALGTQPTAGGTGQGLLIWKDYLFAPRATAMDLYGPLSSSPAWRNSWAGLTMDTDALWHPMIHSKLDDKLYGGAGKYVFTVAEVAGQTFLWSSGATYTATAQALTSIPSAYRIKCLAELGNNLMIGTWQGTNVYDIRKADIFTWDGSSSQHGQPIFIDDFGVHAIMSLNGSLIVLAGTSGTVYKSDGANAYPIGQLPQDLSGGKYLEFYPGALTSHKNKIFFGVGQGGTTAIAGMGVYSLNQTSRGSIVNLEHTISTLNDGSANVLKPTALLPVTRDTILVAWRDKTTGSDVYGIDLTTSTSYAYTTDYSGYFDSLVYDVGVDVDKWKPVKAVTRLGRPLRTGEGIKILYRFSEADSFTTIKTLAFADNGVGAFITKTFPISIPDNVKQTDQVQFRIALLGTSTTSPQFRYAIIE